MIVVGIKDVKKIKDGVSKNGKDYTMYAISVEQSDTKKPHKATYFDYGKGIPAIGDEVEVDLEVGEKYTNINSWQKMKSVDLTKEKFQGTKMKKIDLTDTSLTEEEVTARYKDPEDADIDLDKRKAIVSFIVEQAAKIPTAEGQQAFMNPAFRYLAV